MPLCCAADSPSSEPARGGEPRPVSLVRWRRQLASAGSGCGHHVDEGGLSATRVARGLRCAAQALLEYCRSSAWRLGRGAAVVVADGIWRRRRRLALPSGRNSDPAALAGGGAPTATRPWLRIHLTPFLLNGYPCLLCPCVVCFKFLQPKVIEGKKIDCALADPHLPRLLGGARARPSSSQRTGSWTSRGVAP